MNTDLKKKAKNDFERDFFKLIHNVVFGKTIKLSQQKEEETISRQNQIIILQSFSQRIY